MAAKISGPRALGARGVKIAKGLGLGYRDADGSCSRRRSGARHPVFETAGKLGMPIAIHTGDPKSRSGSRRNADNERFDELRVHPRLVASSARR